MGWPRRTSQFTEQPHPLAEDLDLQPVHEVVRRLNREDRVAVDAVGRRLESVAALARLAAQALGSGGRLIYVGAGTSGRLGALDAAECPPTFGTAPWQIDAVVAGGRRALWRAVEGAEDDRAAGAAQMERLAVAPGDLVCGISASARTPFVQSALKAAKRRGAFTALVCCQPKPPISGLDVAVALDTGPELIAGSTRLKAGTATKLVLNAVSTAALVTLGRIYRGRMIDLEPTNAKLQARATRIVQELTLLPPAEARRLLHRAGSPRMALAMHWTGLGRRGAGRALRQRSLRALEKEAGLALEEQASRRRPGAKKRGRG